MWYSQYQFPQEGCHAPAAVVHGSVLAPIIELTATPYDTHGRLVRRQVFASTEATELDALHGWPGCKSARNKCRFTPRHPAVPYLAVLSSLQQRVSGLGSKR
jgi:hypothetical protein